MKVARPKFTDFPYNRGVGPLGAIPNYLQSLETYLDHLERRIRELETKRQKRQ